MPPSSMLVKRRIEWTVANNCTDSPRPAQPQGASPGCDAQRPNGTGASAQTAQGMLDFRAANPHARTLEEMDALSALLEVEV